MIAWPSCGTGSSSRSTSRRCCTTSPRMPSLPGFIGSPAMNLIQSRLTAADGAATIELGEVTLTLPRSLLARRPARAQYADRDVVVGIRPEDIEDASLVPSANGSSLPVRVTLAEALGSEVILHFPLGERSRRRLPRFPPMRTSPGWACLRGGADRAAEPQEHRTHRTAAANRDRPRAAALLRPGDRRSDPVTRASGVVSGSRPRPAQCPAAPVAQWIEQRFPKPRAHVRFMPGALLLLAATRLRKQVVRPWGKVDLTFRAPLSTRRVPGLVPTT